MPLIFYNNVAALPPDQTNPTPVITSSSTASTPEGDTNFLYLLQTDIPVNQFFFDGGADDALFQIGPASLVWKEGFSPDFEVPSDADTNNTYVTYLKAVTPAGQESARHTLTVTVTDVTELVVGAATFTLTAPSETELQITDPAATNAETLEYDINGNDVWATLT